MCVCVCVHVWRTCGIQQGCKYIFFLKVRLHVSHHFGLTKQKWGTCRTSYFSIVLIISEPANLTCCQCIESKLHVVCVLMRLSWKAKKIVRTLWPTTVGISSDIAKFCLAIVRWPTVICSHVQNYVTLCIVMQNYTRPTVPLMIFTDNYFDVSSQKLVTSI